VIPLYLEKSPTHRGGATCKVLGQSALHRFGAVQTGSKETGVNGTSVRMVTLMAGNCNCRRLLFDPGVGRRVVMQTLASKMGRRV